MNVCYMQCYKFEIVMFTTVAIVSVTLKYVSVHQDNTSLP